MSHLHTCFRLAVGTMASGGPSPPPSKDDPMDLGPFMQEYVLRNPFNPQLLTSPPPVVKPTSAPTIIKPLLKKPECKVAVNVCRSPPISPAPAVSPVVKVETKSPSPVPPSEKIIKQEESANSKQNTPLNSDGEEGGQFVAKEDMLRKVIDTPKAHIGSNASYATQLREMKLPSKHVKVKKW